MSITARITDISRGSVHDGAGLRTVVYLKGCSLKCRWCHNPETISAEPDILYAPVKCIRCGRCVAACPEYHRIEDGDIVFLRDGCRHCGVCAEICPSGALTLCGKEMSVEQVYKEVEKDRHYYDKTGGGLTLSGGECLLQPDFAAALLEKCRQNGIHTAIESAFFVPGRNVEKVLPYLDMAFADMKIADPEKHRLYTGHDNHLITENIKKLTEKCGNVIVRIPLIPCVNDSPEEMETFAEVIKTFGGGLRGVELLRYNHLAQSKYQIAGMRYEAFGTEPQSDARMNLLRAALQSRLPRHINVYFQ